MAESAATSAERDEPGIGRLVRWALWRWAIRSPRRLLFLLRIAWRLWRAHRRRRGRQRGEEGRIPSVVALSPTMSCNYNCVGCYSRSRPSGNELTTEELESLLAEAESLGVLAIVLTGGEPLRRGDTLDLMGRHPNLLFVLITNGSPVTRESAERIAGCGNVIALVSLEGALANTDVRRQPGAYEAAVSAMRRLREARACFGFAAMTTTANMEDLSSNGFVDGMVALDCSVGYFTEYVPCGPSPRPGWVPDEVARAAFRRRIIDLRQRKPIVLIQFPHDEYGPHNRCSGAGQESLHINSQGGVEPCPFLPISRENVRNGGLLAACRSPFLRAIREQPSLLCRRDFACSLFEHRAEVAQIANRFPAAAAGKLAAEGPDGRSQD